MMHGGEIQEDFGSKTQGKQRITPMNVIERRPGYYKIRRRICHPEIARWDNEKKLWISTWDSIHSPILGDEMLAEIGPLVMTLHEMDMAALRQQQAAPVDAIKLAEAINTLEDGPLLLHWDAQVARCIEISARYSELARSEAPGCGACEDSKQWYPAQPTITGNDSSEILHQHKRDHSLYHNCTNAPAPRGGK